jgi:hypothetical protein
VEGVHGEATSNLWYVRSPACSPSMYGKVFGVSNYVNCVGSVRYHRSCPYWVRYSKAWRAKVHALALLWGDWRESYTKVPRLLNAISYFNPGTRCIIDSYDEWLPNEKGRYYLVLKHVFWWFLQCVADFAHCRPIVSVDATFLTGYITYYLVLPIKESFTYTKYYNHNKIYNICRFTNSAR